MNSNFFEGIFIGWVLCRSSFGIMDNIEAPNGVVEPFAIIAVVALFILLQIERRNND